MSDSSPQFRPSFRNVTAAARRRGGNASAPLAAPGYRGAGKLLGRAALITGGDSGIGHAVAALFAREGADVALVYAEDRQAEALRTARSVEREGRRAMMMPGDPRDASFCAAALEGVVHRLGGLDVLVNCASAVRRIDVDGTAEEISRERLATIVEADIFSCFHMTRCALTHMRAGAAIVNTSVLAGDRPRAGLLAHATTSGAIHAFTKSLAQSLLSEGIRVNCVATRHVRARPHAAVQVTADEPGTYAGRGAPARPEEIAPAYVFLASNADSGYITGQVLTVAQGPIAA